MKYQDILKLIYSGKESFSYIRHLFYTCTEWLKLRSEILRDDNNECLFCKAKGFYKRANTVHHVNYLKLHPELALSKTYKDENGIEKRNLISLCHDCHEQTHGYRQEKKEEPITEERW